MNYEAGFCGAAAGPGGNQVGVGWDAQVRPAAAPRNSFLGLRGCGGVESMLSRGIVAIQSIQRALHRFWHEVCKRVAGLRNADCGMRISEGKGGAGGG
jgi:hypothetical protein